jgi:hypothetical protein
MKTKLIAIIVGTCVCTLLTDCTIEKRIFQKGYHLEWKKKAPKKDETGAVNLITENHQETALAAETPAESNLVLKSEKPNPELAPAPEFRAPITEPAILTKKTASIHSREPEKRKITAPAHPTAANDVWEVEERKEFELFGIMSFGLYFSSMALAIAGIILLTSPYFFVAAGFLILLALIFGIISVDKYRRDKSKYHRNFFGYFGMIASLATITFVLALVVLAWGLGSF